MMAYRKIADNGYSQIAVVNDDDYIHEHLYAKFSPNYRCGMRTKHGRRRLQRFIDRLQKALNEFEVMYGKG